MPQVNPHLQEVLPIFSRQDVFGGSLYKRSFLSANGIHKNDCATQCILRIMVSGFPHLPHIPYEAVADLLQSKKRIEDADSDWSCAEKEEWLGHHIAPTLDSILKTIIELTDVDWKWKGLSTEMTLREYAWENRNVPIMAVQTSKHISAVVDGLIYDWFDSRDRIVKSVMYPRRRNVLQETEQHHVPMQTSSRRQTSGFGDGLLQASARRRW